MFCAINVTWPAATLAGTAGSVGRAPRGAIPLIIWVIPMSLSVTVIGEPARAAGAEQTPREWWRVMWASTIGWPPRPAPDGWFIVLQPAKNTTAAVAKVHPRVKAQTCSVQIHRFRHARAFGPFGPSDAVRGRCSASAWHLRLVWNATSTVKTAGR